MKEPVQKERNQMTFKRLLMPVLVTGIIFIMASAGFAQTSINCGLSQPEKPGFPGTAGATPRATATGHTEPISAGPPPAATGVSPPTAGGGLLRVTCINSGGAGGPLDPGVIALTISLGVPITNNTSTTSAAHPSVGAQARIGAASGDFTLAAGSTNVGINSVSNSAGTIVVGLGTPNGLGTTPSTGITFTAGSTSTFDIMGVLVSTNGKTGAITASLSSTGGVSVGGPGGPASLVVIDSVLPGLQDPTVPTSLPGLPFFSGVSGGAAVLNSAGVAIKGNFVLRIPENYQDMYREAAQFNGPGTAGNFPASPAADTQVNIILNNIPAGLDISNCAATMTNAAGSLTSGGTPSINFTNITAASPILTVNFNSAVDLENPDVLWIKCATVAVGSATLPLPSTPVTAQVQLGPQGSALSGGGTTLTGLTTGQVPRYQANLQPATAIPVVIFPPSNTVLLLSFGFVGPGFNTGLAIANTTTDPFGPAGGGATPSEGTVSFLMVKNDGTTKTYVTSAASPGQGLTAGVVKSGSTYVVNLSELLTAAQFGTTFTGYVFMTANFTFAHGAATIYTTSTGAASLSSPVLVLPAVSTAAPRASPEGLSQ
jgi:hypothetical protein